MKTYYIQIHNSNEEHHVILLNTSSNYKHTYLSQLCQFNVYQKTLIYHNYYSLISS